MRKPTPAQNERRTKSLDKTKKLRKVLRKREKLKGIQIEIKDLPWITTLVFKQRANELMYQKGFAPYSLLALTHNLILLL